MLEDRDPFALQHAIGGDDRVGIDEQFLGHPAHAGELFAGLDRAGLNGMLEVLDELEVEGRTR
jgi:hypothetical protein